MQPNLEKMRELFLKITEEGEEGERDIIDILELERPYIYDYLLRMTGQVTLATETISELYRVSAPQVTHYDSWDSYRVLLYTTARNFNLDTWNADTSQLENSGLKKIENDEPLYDKIDQYIRLLPGQHREIFITVHIYGFEAEDVAKITRRSAEVIAIDQGAIIEDLAKRSGQEAEEIKALLSNFPLHQLDDVSTSNTVALSEVMENMEEVEKRHKSERQRRVMTYLILLIAIAVACYFFGVFEDLSKDFP